MFCRLRRAAALATRHPAPQRRFALATVIAVIANSLHSGYRFASWPAFDRLPSHLGCGPTRCSTRKSRLRDLLPTAGRRPLCFAGRQVLPTGGDSHERKVLDLERCALGCRNHCVSDRRRASRPLDRTIARAGGLLARGISTQVRSDRLPDLGISRAADQAGRQALRMHRRSLCS